MTGCLISKSWEEWRREGMISKSTIEVRETQFVADPRRKKGYLYPLQKYDRWGH
jgi:hypothetical protein